jgi:hypothetical protein
MAGTDSPLQLPAFARLLPVPHRETAICCKPAPIEAKGIKDVPLNRL